jgi:hypothetical protein
MLMDSIVYCTHLKMARGGRNMLWGSNNNNNNKSLQLRLLVYCLNEFYVYVTQQDAPYRDKISL